MNNLARTRPGRCQPLSSGSARGQSDQRTCRVRGASSTTGTDEIRRKVREVHMSQARELRFAFVLDDYESALHLYRNVFGLEVVEEL